MSMVVKIVPSPDWFVGVNSLDLCNYGKWTEVYEMDLWPLDAGTQQGNIAPRSYTFPPTSHHDTFFWPSTLVWAHMQSRRFVKDFICCILYKTSCEIDFKT